MSHLMLIVLGVQYFKLGAWVLTAAQPDWAFWLCVTAEPRILWGREAKAVGCNPGP